jgi:hypothetical protein
LSALRFVSQPLAGAPSQLPKPGSHAPRRQVASTHDAAALAKTQRFPQPPHWLTLVEKSASQPLLRLPSQLPKPPLHAIATQVPPAQVGDPFVLSQREPHAPQLFGLLLVFTSQKSLAMPLQSASGAVHIPPSMHDELAQNAVRPAPPEQRLPQVPQLVTSVATLVSQPSVGSLLQSRKPALHAPIVHTPDTQVGVALAKRQRLLHAPQLFGSVAVAVSQPAAVLQSPKPVRHAV